MARSAKIMIGDSRSMVEVMDSAVDLVITSPPYWQIKDYQDERQTGYGQTLHRYLKDLYLVWGECFRVLAPGRRLCLNIGDQFARASIYGRYKVIPLHAEMIAQCENIGFDFMGSIIWQKKTTMKTSGGAVIMGSYPYPPNGIVEIDHEYILVFKKPGKGKKIPKGEKDGSRLTKAEWKEYFSGHWTFKGAKQMGHEAMFPEELPRRLIRMFSFKDETVLDPFLGSGTTLKVALELDRNGLGYEINKVFLDTIKKKVAPNSGFELDICTCKRDILQYPSTDDAYIPSIMDASARIDPKSVKQGPDLKKVVSVVDERTVRLDDGSTVSLLGIVIPESGRKKVLEYLKGRVMKKKVFIRVCEESSTPEKDHVEAYLYLKNRIFVNRYLIKSGLAEPDVDKEHPKKDLFLRLFNDRKAAR